MAPSLVVQAEESTSAFFGASITALTGTPWNLQASHIFPAYVSIASAAVLFVNFLVASKYTRPVFTRLGLFAKGAGEDAVEETSSEGHIQAHGGRVIFTFEVFTAIGCIGLLWVALLRAFAFEGPQRDDLIVAAIPFAYTSLLALFSVVYPRFTIASSHVPLVLAASWIIYFIRDLIPLMTYTEIPLDPLYMLWELIALLSFTGVILPVVKPRQYVPFDPSDPMPPNPSQTASILSLAIFQYLDPTVWLAYRVPHLPLTDLPPLADSDHSKHLIRAAFPHLDPFAEVNLGDGKGSTHKKEKRPPRSMILGVLTVFRKDVIVAALLLLLNNAFAIANPYGLKKLLEYLETNGEGATIRPWVWIASLFIIPFTSTLLLQQYSMILARASIHLTAVLTQLILQHALRIRIIAEAKSDSAIGASKAPSIADSGLSSPPESEATAVASESEASKANPGDTGSANAKSLVGRMNNLISSDLEAITKASEFLQVFIAAPVMIIFCVAFLYTILGWSALVGFGVMLAMMPVPIAFSKMLQSASKEVSKKSDDRVETVTETMSVIRMVKMFGWETKMAERIDEKREIELSWVWWNKIFSLLAMNFNFIIPAVTMCVTFSVYALVMKGTLNASIVFASISLFDILRFRTHMIFLWVPMVIKGGVSLQRIHDFLYDTELLDEFTDDPSTQEALLNLDSHRDEIGFASASFSWSNEDSNLLGTLTPSKRRFRLHIENELLFKRGAFNLIIGPTGKPDYLRYHPIPTNVN
ncbi:hypothetical protein H0H92_015875 [Tricholoma furcatifolium]|nr:hypothetical protein H0H92_015875 [Tricholoma furcatifolium]